ncbi:MAG: glycosyltransferase [Caldimicrobium sp.]|nr:glycosyltransferase [Caldimicrobium sp.]
MGNFKEDFKNIRNKVKNILGKYKIFTHLDGIIDGVIIGWIISRKEILFEVFIDNRKIQLKDSTIKIFPAPDIHPEAYRFSINLNELLTLQDGLELNMLVNGRQVKKTPLTINKTQYFANIDTFSGYECIGWAGSPLGEIPELKVVIDEELVETNFEWYMREDFRKFGIKIPTGFKFKIPEKFLDGRSYKVCLVNPYTNQKLCKEKEFRFKVKNFYIDKADSDVIAGWIQIEDYPGPVDLSIYIDNEKVATVLADFVREDAEKEYGKGCYGFYYSFSEKDKLNILKNKDNYGFFIYLGDTKIKIADSYSTVTVLDILENLEKVSQSVRERGDKILTHYLKTAIDLIRMNIKKDSTNSRIIFKNIVDVVDVVDVVIPVYRGKKETLECISSVLNAKTNIPFEVIVINDFTPEKDLREELINLAKQNKITLIENKENLGFVKSANIGMKLHPDRDLVLLNSDTLVPDYWLDRLREAAYKEKNIATVTPLSNKATILSIPEPNYDNDIPEGLDYREIDLICQSVNRGVTVDIPTAIGFCMYIKRECINEVGYFDEERFDKGYGEENDFCMRASSLGWRHVACLDTFIEHRGSISFGSERSNRVEKALQVINELYPDYNARIQRFIKKDSLAPYRNKIIKEILKKKFQKYVIFVLHTWGGGCLKYCKDLAKLLKEEAVGTLFLYPFNGGLKLTLYEEKRKEGSISLVYPGYTFLDTVSRELTDLPILFVHYNHTVEFRDLSIWRLPEILNVPYYVTIHDYYYICPRIHLINSSGIFCGHPEVSVCEQCLMSGRLSREVEIILEREFNHSISNWRNFYKVCLEKAKRVICPSETCKGFIEKVFKLNNLILLEHPDYIESEIKFPEVTEKLKIAIIGAIGEHKGYYQLLNLIKYSQERNLPFEFIVIGYTMDDKKIKEFKNVIITGKYEEEELKGLVEFYKPHLALFLHQWPETYSYTLSEALRNGLYPVVCDIGAPAERVKKLGIGTLVSYPSTTEEIVKILINLVKERWERKKVAINNEYSSILRNYYVS